MNRTESILKKYGYRDSKIIQVMNDIQAEYNYLPREELDFISHRLKIPLSKIYSIATFYGAFSLKPRGEHLVTLCLGTACFVRNITNVLDRIEDRLGIKAGDTTADNKFTLETVNCMGACALAPIVVIDGEYFGQTTVRNVDAILDKYLQARDDKPGEQV